MKIKLYFGREDAIKKSGIGRALVHQKKALSLNGIEYTTDKDDTDYDILHINTVWPDGLKVIRHAKKNNKKVIYHAHSTQEDFKNSFMFSNALSGLFKRWLIHMYSKADFILTPTPYSKKILDSYNMNVNIQDISNGVDLEEFNPTVEQISEFSKQFNIKDDEVLIISVGWLFERKGFDTFVDVAKKLPDYKFMWFGDIKLSNPTKKIRNVINNLPSNAILPGYIDSGLLRGAYGKSTAFFFPSREETEGIVVLEALSCKTQMVLRDIPVFDEWLEDKVHCYKGKDVEEFVSIIEGIANNKYPSTIEKGYEVAQSRELSKIGEKLKGIYIKVLNK
ncbi:MAG: glycosyltransferase family 4 protein [Coprobacillaceae bacterium]